MTATDYTQLVDDMRQTQQKIRSMTDAIATMKREQYKRLIEVQDYELQHNIKPMTLKFQ